MRKKYLDVGRITSTHALRGEVRFEPWCDGAGQLRKVKTLYFDTEGKRPVPLEGIREHGRIMILKLGGVDSVEDAAVLRGKVLRAARDDLPLEEGRWFISELIGCEVRDADTGRVYGKVADVTNHGSGDIWTVRDGGKEYLFPAVGGMVENVDIDADTALIRPIRGIFDDGFVED